MLRHSSNGTGNRIVCKSTGGWICEARSSVMSVESVATAA